MEHGKRKTSEEKILELMNSADKNSAAYQHVEKALAGRDLAMVSIDKMSQVEDKYYPKIAAQVTNKSLSMEEIVKACLSFQQISTTPELNKVFFDFLMEPAKKRMSKLEELSGANANTLNQDTIDLAKEQKEQLDDEIIKGCIELQDSLTSSEAANHVLNKSIELVWPRVKNDFMPPLTIPAKHIYRIPEGSWYRGMIVASFFKINREDNASYNYWKNTRKFWSLLDFFNREQHLPKLFQRADLSETEKNIYIYAAIRQSKSSLSEDAIDYFRENIHTKSSSETAKQIAGKEIVYLIAKEVNTDTAIALDEMLRGNRKKTADIMAKLYTEVPLTLVKEFIRKQVETSFDPDEKLAFYKKSTLQRLVQENYQGTDLSPKAALDPNVEYNKRQAKRIGTVPKTNPAVVAFDALKGQGMKEASVNNQQKKRNESIVQEQKKAFEK